MPKQKPEPFPAVSPALVSDFCLTTNKQDSGFQANPPWYNPGKPDSG
jgi:hypothetical protein